MVKEVFYFRPARPGIVLSFLRRQVAIQTDYRNLMPFGLDMAVGFARFGRCWRGPSAAGPTAGPLRR